MMQVRMIIHCTVVPSPGETTDDLDSHFDAVADEFHADKGITDQSMAYNLTRGRMSFEMVIQAEDVLEALSKAYSHVRSAIHGAGGDTPGWELDVRDLSHELEGDKACV